MNRLMAVLTHLGVWAPHPTNIKSNYAFRRQRVFFTVENEIISKGPPDSREGQEEVFASCFVLSPDEQSQNQTDELSVLLGLRPLDKYM